MGTTSVNIKGVSSQLWSRVKIMKIKRDTTILKIVEQALADLLKKEGV